MTAEPVPSAIPGLVIAEERIEWGIHCALSNIINECADAADAQHAARGCDREGCGPHRVVSRRVITTEWAEQ